LIYNGYDPADLPARNEEAQSYFSLCYTGNLKPNQNVGALWQAIAALRERKPDFKSLLRLEWVGNVDAGTQEALVKSGLDSITTYHGYQPHAAATEAMVKAGALLFIVPQTTDNALILTGKLFEYLGSASPLLSIGPPDGNAARIIEGTGRGKMIEYSDQKAMEARLLYLFESWQKRQRSPALSSEAVAEYTREGAARKLSQILEELCR
jgi:glycosyltransferase involved in cell wall biosynthesis